MAETKLKEQSMEVNRVRQTLSAGQDSVSNTDGAFVDLANATVTLLDVQAGSNIIVWWSANCSHTTAGQRIGIQVVVNGSALSESTRYCQAHSGSTGGTLTSFAGTYYGSAPITGNIIVKLQFASVDSSPTAYIEKRRIMVQEEIA